MAVPQQMLMTSRGQRASLYGAWAGGRLTLSHNNTVQDPTLGATFRVGKLSSQPIEPYTFLKERKDIFQKSIGSWVLVTSYERL